MFVVNNFMMAVTGLIDFLFTAYIWIIIGRAVISSSPPVISLFGTLMFA